MKDYNKWYDKLIHGFPAVQVESGKWIAFEFDGAGINSDPMNEKKLREYLKEY